MNQLGRKNRHNETMFSPATQMHQPQSNKVLIAYCCDIIQKLDNLTTVVDKLQQNISASNEEISQVRRELADLKQIQINRSDFDKNDSKDNLEKDNKILIREFVEINQGYENDNRDFHGLIQEDLNDGTEKTERIEEDLNMSEETTGNNTIKSVTIEEILSCEETDIIDKLEDILKIDDEKPELIKLEEDIFYFKIDDEKPELNKLDNEKPELNKLDNEKPELIKVEDILKIDDEKPELNKVEDILKIDDEKPDGKKEEIMSDSNSSGKKSSETKSDGSYVKIMTREEIQASIANEEKRLSRLKNEKKRKQCQSKISELKEMLKLPSNDNTSD